MKIKQIILVISSVLCGCVSSTIDIAGRIPEFSSKIFNTSFKPNLPYREIAKSIGEVRYYGSSSDRRFHNFTLSVSEIHEAIIEYAVQRYQLSSSERNILLESMQEQKGKIANIYFEDLRYQLMSSDEYLPRQNKVFNYPTYLSVNAFSKIISSKICSIAEIIIGVLVKKPGVSIGIPLMNHPCEILLAEALVPIIEGLKNQALIIDHLNAQFSITEHVREMIMELATVQDKFKVDYSIQPDRKILWWTSKAELKMKVTGIVKAGFDLKSFFSVSIDDGQKKIFIHLPKPTLLSTDISPVITNMENGWFVEIDQNKLNDAMYILRQRIQATAISSGLLQQAERNAINVVKSIFAPIAELPQFTYSVEVDFGGSLKRNNGVERYKQ
jgi:hypothetical protein